MDRQPTDGGLWLGANPPLFDPRSGCLFYGTLFVRCVRTLGIRDHPTSARSPWQNGYAERLIGSIRRECLDHIIVVGEQHQLHILMCYMEYCNAVRTHLSLSKDAPVRRVIQHAGCIEARPILGGLHHQYVRI
ncbi:MAG: integrase core domain-containing protein [Sphingobacteriales bacterium]|jgi:transposase InsO family protein